MTKLTLNDVEIQRWFNDMGDYTHILNYDLNENSNVIDLGGYTGVWSELIIEKYKIQFLKLQYDQTYKKQITNRTKWVSST